MSVNDNETRDDPRVGAARPKDRGTRVTKAISRATATAGSFPMILFAMVLVAAWLIGGIFVKGHYGNTAYQLPVSTISSIVTFVMVFVIQSSQNRTAALCGPRTKPGNGESPTASVHARVEATSSDHRGGEVGVDE